MTTVIDRLGTRRGVDCTDLEAKVYELIMPVDGLNLQVQQLPERMTIIVQHVDITPPPLPMEDESQPRKGDQPPSPSVNNDYACSAQDRQPQILGLQLDLEKRHVEALLERGDRDEKIRVRVLEAKVADLIDVNRQSPEVDRNIL